MVFLGHVFRAEHIGESDICQEATSNVAQAVGANERTERTSRVGVNFLLVHIQGSQSTLKMKFPYFP